jgi:hypothetical protein
VPSSDCKDRVGDSDGCPGGISPNDWSSCPPKMYLGSIKTDNRCQVRLTCQYLYTWLQKRYKQTCYVQITNISQDQVVQGKDTCTGATLQEITNVKEIAMHNKSICELLEWLQLSQANLPSYWLPFNFCKPTVPPQAMKGNGFMEELKGPILCQSSPWLV